MAIGRKPEGENPAYSGPDAGGTDKPSLTTVASIKESPSFVREERKCRDVLFLLIFFIFWIGMLVVAGFGYENGDPNVLVYGLDYTGRTCDSDGEPSLVGFEARFWPNAKQVGESSANLIDVDLANLDVDLVLESGLADAKSLCVKECPQPITEDDNTTIRWVCNYPNANLTLVDGKTFTLDEWADASYDYYTHLQPRQKISSFQLQGPCYPVLLKSINSYESCQYYDGIVDSVYQTWRAGECAVDPTFDETACPQGMWAQGVEVTDADGAIETAIKDQLTSGVAVMERYVADLGRAWKICLVCGAVLPLVLSFAWLLFMRYFSGLMAWLTVFIANLLMLVLTAVLFVKAGIIGDDEIDAVAGSGFTESLPDELDASKENRNVLRVFAVLCAVATVALIVVSVLMVKRIKIAIATLKVATQAVSHVPSVMLFPVLPFLLLLVLGAYWLVTAVYLFSAARVEQRTPLVEGGKCVIDTSFCGGEGGEACDCGFELSFTQDLKYMLLYHFFGLLWTVQFIYAFAMCTIAGAISYFYWTRGDASKAPMLPLLSSFKRVCKYHLGSLALGSLIVAIIQFIRALMAYVDRKFKSIQEKNELARFLMCCIHSCLWCIEKIIAFISRNAYILIAIDGEGFCASAREAMKLINNNILRIAAVNTVGDAILFMGKVAVAAGCGIISFWMMDQETYQTGPNKISQPLLPVIFVVFVSFCVASVFMAVMEMAVDTIILSFCLDCEEHNGTPMYAPPLLVDALDQADLQRKQKSGENRTGG